VTKESMKGAIKWIRKESIRQSGQRIATELLNSHLYDEMLPAKFVSAARTPSFSRWSDDAILLAWQRQASGARESPSGEPAG